MLIYLSLLICIIGAFMYALAANPKLQELGRIMFGVGLLCFLAGDSQLLSLLHR